MNETAQPKFVPVEVERLQRMMNLAGELVIHRTQIRERLAELQSAAGALKLCGRRIKLYEDASQPGERNADCSGLLAEISAKLSEALAGLGGFERRIDGEMDEFTRLAQRMQDEIRQASGLGATIAQALIVRCGSEKFALPLNCVEEVRRIRVPEIADQDGKLTVSLGEVAIEVVHLDQALQLSPLEPVNGFLPMVRVNVGRRQAGVVVQEVLRNDDIVIDKVQEELRNAKLFCGASRGPDGSLTRVLDMNALILGECRDSEAAQIAHMNQAAVPRTAGEELFGSSRVKRPAPASLAATVAAAMQPAVIAPPVSIPGAQITGAVEIRVPVPAAEAGNMQAELARLQAQVAQLENELAAERQGNRS